MRDAIDEPVSAIVDSVIACLGEAPPELAHDLIVRGMYLVGGGGMLKGLARRIANETEIPVHLVDAPLECVVLGAGRCIEAYDQLKVMFMGARCSTARALRRVVVSDLDSSLLAGVVAG